MSLLCRLDGNDGARRCSWNAGPFAMGCMRGGCGICQRNYAVNGYYNKLQLPLHKVHDLVFVFRPNNGGNNMAPPRVKLHMQLTAPAGVTITQARTCVQCAVREENKAKPTGQEICNIVVRCRESFLRCACIVHVN